jgi:hypothetical protein
MLAEPQLRYDAWSPPRFAAPQQRMPWLAELGVVEGADALSHNVHLQQTNLVDCLQVILAASAAGAFAPPQCLLSSIQRMVRPTIRPIPSHSYHQ